MKHLFSAQRGATLLVSLVMLVVITLFVLTTFNLGKSSLQIVGNMQQRNQAVTSAQSAIEEAISTTRFFQSPNLVFLASCAGINARCYDVNGDGKPDVTVTLTPVPFCIIQKTIPNASLDLSNAEDLGCSVGQSQSFGIVGSATGNSLCANSIWEINAVATDAVTQARATVTQGIAVRVSTDNVASICPGP
jgi:Tfp pilus assembly protein PilX